MTWLDKLERRFGFLGIPGLIRIVIGFTALVYVLVYLNRGFESFLTLDPALILRGQVWRLVTYIFLPQTFSPLWVLLALWFLWFIGEGLERAWGAFRLTLYFVVGMVGTTMAAFFFGGNFSNGMLITSLFFAFARFYPEEVIYILFISSLRSSTISFFSDRRLFIKRDIGATSRHGANVLKPTRAAPLKRFIGARSVAPPSKAIRISIFASRATAKNIAWRICQRWERPDSELSVREASRNPVARPFD
jgi:membrane associated rhomboid family serine protease